MAEWCEFLSAYAAGRVGRLSPPPVPKVIADFLGSDDFVSGKLLAEQCTPETPYPHTPEEVRSLLSRWWDPGSQRLPPLP